MVDLAPCSDKFTALMNTISKEIMESMPPETTAKLGHVDIECNTYKNGEAEALAYVEKNRIVLHEYRLTFQGLPDPKYLAKTLCHELSHIYNYRVYDGKRFYTKGGRALYYYGHGSPTFKEFAETCYNDWAEQRDADMDISKGIE